MPKYLNEMFTFPLDAPLMLRRPRFQRVKALKQFGKLCWSSRHEKSIFRKGYRILPVHRRCRKKNTLWRFSANKNKMESRFFFFCSATCLPASCNVFFFFFASVLLITLTKCQSVLGLWRYSLQPSIWVVIMSWFLPNVLLSRGLIKNNEWLGTKTGDSLWTFNSPCLKLAG